MENLKNKVIGVTSFLGAVAFVFCIMVFALDISIKEIVRMLVFAVSIVCGVVIVVVLIFVGVYYLTK